MITDTLKVLFKRDLEQVKTEIKLYTIEEDLWIINKSISNSAGNLCLHIIGNLNATIGAGLTKTGYIRQRELEFSLKGISRAKLISQIDALIITIENGLNSLTESQMTDDFPDTIWKKSHKTEYTLVLLISHLSYHLGQINYHRRLLDH